MGSLTKLAAVSLLGVFLFPGTLSRAEEQSATAQPTAPPPKSLFAQSAVQILGREFRDGGVSYLLFDARSANLLSSRWDDPASPIPLGSLVKPFTALAYAETHDFQYPTYVCKGEASGCWQLRPHGKLDIVSAIAVSCNSYFRNLAQNLRAEQLLRTTNRFALESPDLKLAGPDLMPGNTSSEWRTLNYQPSSGRRRDRPSKDQGQSLLSCSATNDSRAVWAVEQTEPY